MTTKKPLKWPTPEKRKEAFADFIKHIEEGLSIESWEGADFHTTKKYMKEFPEEFVAEEYERALRKARTYLERVGIKGTIGEIKNFNPYSYRLIMSNKFGWNEKTIVNSTITKKLEASDEEILNQYITNQLKEKKDKNK